MVKAAAADDGAPPVAVRPAPGRPATGGLSAGGRRLPCRDAILVIGGTRFLGRAVVQEGRSIAIMTSPCSTGD